MKTFKQHLSESTSRLNGLRISRLVDFLTETFLAETPFLGATMRPFPHDELQAYLGRSVTKTKLQGDKYKMPYIHGSNIQVTGEEGKAYDLDALKKLITQRPARITKQNEKMQHSDGTSSIFFNVGLPALKGLAVNEKTGEFVIVDTCPGAGACKTYCYAMKGGYVQWKASSLGVTRVLNFLLNDPDGFKHLLSTELQDAERKYSKKGTKVVVRWHDAGDFFSPEYMEVAYSVARQFPNIDFYAYTKIAAVAQSNKPANFKMNFSQGAQPSQEKMIDFARTKHSKVVQKDLFMDLIARKGTSLIRDVQGRMQFRDAAALEEFKHRMAHKYALQVDTIITYDEMMKMPLGPTPHWNVLVWSGHGDDSANRHDVIGTYLLLH
jgi:hypothetical protein